MPASVRVVFLGGLGEIGRNCMAIEHDDSILLIDCGLMFPDADMHGIDLVLPDFTWLRENADRIVGCVATHGHEDHVGGLQFLLRDVSFPVFGSAVTLTPSRSRCTRRRVSFCIRATSSSTSHRWTDGAPICHASVPSRPARVCVC